MRNKATTPLVYTVNRGAVCVADGYRVTVRVRNGRLIVEDGFGPERRRREYTRVTEPISRLVVIGNGGSVSLEALCWLHDVGAAFVHVARDGRLIATTAHDVADAKLRRAQSLAVGNGLGLGIVRFILSKKLDGQRHVLRQITNAPHLSNAFEDAATRLAAGATLDELVWAERDAALAYWTGWATVEMRFKPSDARRLPEHWLRFGQRSSPLTSASRLAVNPANALLNYLYALLEAEARLACLAVGLDPTVGIVHADYRSRDSLALDLMEAVRPAVDEHVLALLRQRTFRASGFTETRNGICRIKPPLTRQLSTTTPMWRQLLAPVSEAIPRMLTANTSAGPRPLPTPAYACQPQRLARSSPSTTTARLHAGADLQALRWRAPQPAARLLRHLPADLPTRPTPSRRRESGGRGCSQVARRGHEPWRQRQGTSRRDKHGSESRGKGMGRAARQARRPQLLRPRDPAADVSLSRLVRATGLSLRYVSLIRRGAKRPHPRHWRGFLAAAEEAA